MGGRSLVGALLGSAVAVFIGRISFSLYLWHWPVLVFSRQYLGRPLFNSELIVLLAFTSIAAILSYRLVEQPYRRPDGVFRRNGIFISAATTIMALVILGGVTIAKDGFPRRFNGSLELADPEVRHRICLLTHVQTFDDWGQRRCLVNDRSEPLVMLWGDSYAAHYLPAFLNRRSEINFNLLQYNLEACAPAFEDDAASTPTCQAFNRAARQIIDRFEIKFVLLAGNWNGYRMRVGGDAALADSLSKTVAGLRAQGVKVAIVGQTPTFKTRVPRIYYWRLRNGQLVNPEADADPGHELNYTLKVATSGATFLEPSVKLCSGASCTIGEGLKPYYWDTGHFTTTGSIRAMEPLWQPLENFVRGE
jgi:hypothetical protein